MLISRIFKRSIAKICQTALNEVLQISRNPGNPASLCNYEKPRLLLKTLMVSSAFVLNLQFYTYTPATWVPGSSPSVLHCQRALVKHLWATLYLLVNCSIQKEMQLILRSASGLVLEAVKWAPENSPLPGELRSLLLVCVGEEQSSHALDVILISANMCEAECIATRSLGNKTLRLEYYLAEHKNGASLLQGGRWRDWPFRR